MIAATALHGDPALAPHVAEARRLARLGVAVLLLGVLPVAAWLAWAPLSSAVVAGAFVKVDLDRRPVQHAEGGLVREVLVRDGQRVAKGQPLLLLGDVSVDADQQRLSYRVAAERASMARLEAEQLGAGTLAFPADVTAAAARDPQLAEHLNKERALFDARRDALGGQVALLRVQRERVTQEEGALREQIAQATASLALQKTELETNRNLVKDGFVSATRLSQIEATVADYGVKLEERRSELARAQQRAVDTDLRARSLSSDYRQQASDQLKLASVRLADLQQELRKSSDAAARQVIAAPADGEVVNLRYPSAGAVIPPRESIADIVPADPRLVIEAQIRTEDIGRIQRGQPADIRFTAFRHRSTPTVAGRVFYVSADRLVDRQTGLAYYVASIEADADALKAAGDLQLQAGMPAEVYIRGDERTPLQYLLEPVTEVLRRAGRER